MTILDEPDLGASFENAKQTMVQIHIYTDLSDSVYSDASYTSNADYDVSDTGYIDSDYIDSDISYTSGTDFEASDTSYTDSYTRDSN